MTSSDTPAVTVFCLHYLGGSAREWSKVEDASKTSIRWVPIDAPGFGNARDEPGFSVESMATFAAQIIRREQAKRWMLVGHSMGAKVATVLARWVSDGTLDLAGLLGLVLIAGSPPSAEPMTDDKRDKMSGWFQGDQAQSSAEARQYVADNVGAPLAADDEEIAFGDVLASNHAAWIAWLQEGSKEDWSARIGVLNLPALIVTGSADDGLGHETQRKTMAPHFANLDMVELPGAGHLLPLERPAEIADLIGAHVEKCLWAIASAKGSPSYLKLIASKRVGEGTRQALLRRIDWQAKSHDQVLSDAQLAILDRMLDRVLPQGVEKIDLAGRLDDELASQQGDGWRFSSLPEDRLAYPLGLDTLEAAAQTVLGKGFAALDPIQQDELLEAVAGGQLPVVPRSEVARLSAEQMQKWFEDVCADATRLYMAHPQTLARIGYSGIANGGDGFPKSGFIRIGVGESETWEPKAKGSMQ